MIDASVRPARQSDLAPCVAMVNEWIDATDWHPRVHSAEDIVRYYRTLVWAEQDVRVAGAPPTGFVAVSDDGFVTALYAQPVRHGTGTRLMRAVQSDYSTLSLWTHQPNTQAQEFYATFDFAEVRRTDGDNEEGVPDILYRWNTGRAA